MSTDHGSTWSINGNSAERFKFVCATRQMPRRTSHALGVTDGNKPTFQRKGADFLSMLKSRAFLCNYVQVMLLQLCKGCCSNYSSCFHFFFCHSIWGPAMGRHSCTKTCTNYRIGQLTTWAIESGNEQTDCLLAQAQFVNFEHREPPEAPLCFFVPTCCPPSGQSVKGVWARFPEAVHGKKHLNNFQNKTQFLGRHLESYSFLWSPKFLTPVTLILYLFSENEPQNQTSTCNSVLCQQDLNRTIDRLSTGRLGQESEKKRRLQQVSRCIKQCELQQLATALFTDLTMPICSTWLLGWELSWHSLRKLQCMTPRLVNHTGLPKVGIPCVRCFRAKNTHAHIHTHYIDMWLRDSWLTDIIPRSFFKIGRRFGSAIWVSENLWLYRISTSCWACWAQDRGLF